MWNEMNLEREKLRQRDFARLRSDLYIENNKVVNKTSDVNFDLQKTKGRLAKLFENLEQMLQI